MERVVISADSHVMEPADLWQRYLEPEFRDRAIRIERRDGIEHLIIGEQSVLSGVLAGLGGAHRDRSDIFSGQYSYADSFFLNSQALIQQIAQRFPALLAANLGDYNIESGAGSLDQIAADCGVSDRDGLWLYVDAGHLSGDGALTLTDQFRQLIGDRAASP